MATDYEPNPEDERVVEIDDTLPPEAPPTIDPDERVERESEPDPEAISD